MAKPAKLKQAKLASPSWKLGRDSQPQAKSLRLAALVVKKAKSAATQLRQQGFKNPFVYLVDSQTKEVAALAKQMLETEGNPLNIEIRHESDL